MHWSIRCWHADIIDEGGVTRKVVEATRSYLELPHFNRDIIQNKSKAAAGLCDWAINIVKYFDVVIDVAPKKAELAEANAKLADANETLEVVMSKVCCCLTGTVSRGRQWQ